MYVLVYVNVVAFVKQHPSYAYYPVSVIAPVTVVSSPQIVHIRARACGRKGFTVDATH